MRATRAPRCISPRSPARRSGPGKRDLIVESVYEYGSRAGFWRLMRMFGERDIPITVFGAALALERNPAAAAAIRDAGYEVCSHGWRWIGFPNMAEDEERAQMRRAVDVDRAHDRDAPVRLVLPLRAVDQHAPARRRGGRLSLRLRCVQRRLAVLDARRRQAASGDSVHARRQRHEVLRRARLHVGRGVLRLPQGCVRRALSRRERPRRR